MPRSCLRSAEAMPTEIVGPYLIEVARQGGRLVAHTLSRAHPGGGTQRGGVRRCGPARDGRKLAMYAYDNYDHSLVAERVAQFREQVARRIAGEISEDEFKPLRLMNGLYLQLHAYMLRIAIPYGTLSSPPAAPAGPYRAALRPRLRPFHHPPEHPVQLDQAGGDAGYPGRAGRGRDARHPDQRQLHPQRHRRSFRRRGRRRDRGSAHLVRDRPAMVDLPSRILLPAAQVQDRHHRRAP